jgi:B9 domain-containing protein 2
VLAGQEAGETFYDSSENQEGLAIFEHPIDIQYACRSIVGWPKVAIEVWSVDEHGRHTIAGYGILSIPCTPGQYMLTIPTWRPIGTAKEQSYSHYLGINPELAHKNVLFSGNDRFGMRTYSTGTVNCRIGVLVKDFHLHGVKL